MSDVKIYTVVSDELSPPINGDGFCTDMVRYSDYAALQAERDALAAENAALKELIEMHGASFSVCPNCSHEEPSETDDIVALYRSLGTTATDAFLREQQAKGADAVAAYHLERAEALQQSEPKFAFSHRAAYLAACDVAAQLRAGEAV